MARLRSAEIELAELNKQEADVAATLNQIRRLSSCASRAMQPFVQAIQKHHVAVEQQNASDDLLKEQTAVVGRAKDLLAAASDQFTSMADDLGLRSWSDRLEELNRTLADTRSDLRSLGQQIEVVHRQAETVRQSKDTAERAKSRAQGQQFTSRNASSRSRRGTRGI